jgi:hypothetical protein
MGSRQPAPTANPTAVAETVRPLLADPGNSRVRIAARHPRILLAASYRQPIAAARSTYFGTGISLRRGRAPSPAPRA